MEFRQKMRSFLKVTPRSEDVRPGTLPGRHTSVELISETPQSVLRLYFSYPPVQVVRVAYMEELLTQEGYLKSYRVLLLSSQKFIRGSCLKVP